MSFFSAVKLGFTGLSEYYGKRVKRSASRSDFLYWHLFLITILGVPYLISYKILLGSELIIGHIITLVAFVMIPPTLNIYIYRLHDINQKSGAWLFLIIPIIALASIYLGRDGFLGTSVIVFTAFASIKSKT